MRTVLVLDQIDGLPLHPLVIHAVVVLGPLAAVLALAHLVPAWRRVLRWPVAVLAVLASAAAFVAVRSGEALRDAISDQLEGNPTGALVEQHQALGERLQWVLLAMAVVAVVVAVLGRLDRSIVGHVLAVVLVLVGGYASFLTYQTGDKGARAVWNPTGSISYSD